MSKLTMKQLTENVTKLEAGKKEVSIAQVKEILGVVADMIVGPNGEEVVKVLTATGKRRAKAFAKKTSNKKVAKRMGSKKKVAKKVTKKVAKKPTKKVAKKAVKKVAKKATPKKTVAPKKTPTPNTPTPTTVQ